MMSESSLRVIKINLYYISVEINPPPPPDNACYDAIYVLVVQ